jgi:hypothetical protein
MKDDVFEDDDDDDATTTRNPPRLTCKPQASASAGPPVVMLLLSLSGLSVLRSDPCYASSCLSIRRELFLPLYCFPAKDEACSVSKLMHHCKLRWSINLATRRRSQPEASCLVMQTAYFPFVNSDRAVRLIAN